MIGHRRKYYLLAGDKNANVNIVLTRGSIIWLVTIRRYDWHAFVEEEFLVHVAALHRLRYWMTMHDALIYFVELQKQRNWFVWLIVMTLWHLSCYIWWYCASVRVFELTFVTLKICVPVYIAMNTGRWKSGQPACIFSCL